MQWQPNLNPFELVIPSMIIVWTFGIISFHCEFGEFVMNQFGKFNDQLCQCNWYLLPIEIQRILVIAMLNTQQPVIIRGIANAMCTREVFKKVQFSFFL